MTLTTIQDVEDILPEDCIMEICCQGGNDCAVAEWVDYLDTFDMSVSKCKAIIQEYGLEIEDSSIESLKATVLWIAAWNRYDLGGRI